MAGTQGTERGSGRPSDRRRRLLLAGAALACLALAVVWMCVVPAEAGAAAGIRGLLLTYGHAACWSLLALSAASAALRAPRAMVSLFMWSALACYVAFLGAWLL